MIMYLKRKVCFLTSEQSEWTDWFISNIMVVGVGSGHSQCRDRTNVTPTASSLVTFTCFLCSCDTEEF